MREFYFLVVASLGVSSSAAAAADFVPFVIPTQPNADSLIAMGSEPIGVDAERVVVRDGHFYRKDRRVRFWGVNLSWGASFPKREDAPHIAERVAAVGFNSVRFHLMDVRWFPRGLWNAKDGKTIEPEALDRMDYFVDQLARRGVSVNLNLHVGRDHSRHAGLPKAGCAYDRVIGNFTPALIEAQREYARQLLGRINRCRKVRYADDPAIAVVEITNENSFFMWDGEETVQMLPPYYAGILKRKFSTWLKQRYGSTDRLRTAWAAGASPLGENQLAGERLESPGPDKLPEGWHLEQSKCKAHARCQRDGPYQAIRVEVDDAESDTWKWFERWNVRLVRRGLSVKKGCYYTIVFRARSDQPRRIYCDPQQAHGPWEYLGQRGFMEVTPDWQTFRFGFLARADEDDARLRFTFPSVGRGESAESRMGADLAGVEFFAGGRKGLEANESIEAANVAVVADSETAARAVDAATFLAETEKSYFDEMYAYVKNELGCKAPVTGTSSFGPLGLYGQSDMDFIDAHRYWGRREAMTDHPDEATLFYLAGLRLAGKPFTVSEYNHAVGRYWPGDYRAECVPMIASFAAAQDWDGVWLFHYNDESVDLGWDRQSFHGYNELCADPARLGFIPAGAAIFRDGGIAPLAPAKSVALTGASDRRMAELTWLHHNHNGSHNSTIDQYAVLKQQTGVTWQDILQTRFAVTLFAKHSPAPASAAAENAGRLDWSINADGKGLFSASGHAAWVWTGHAEDFANMTNGRIAIAQPSFAAVTVTALDGAAFSESQTILITACGRCENTGMAISEDRRRVSNWGHAPVQIQAVEGTLALPPGRWTCHALGPDGLPRREVSVSHKNGQSVVEISSQYKTMWYLLTRHTESDASPTRTSKE